MVYRDYIKYRIVVLHSRLGYRPPTICKILRQEGEHVSRRGVCKFIQRYKKTGTVRRKKGSGGLSTTSQQISNIVEAKMREDDETTAVQLHHHLTSEGKEKYMYYYLEKKIH